MSGFKYGLGCLPSKLDGTERTFSPDEKAKLPDEFDWRPAMIPVEDQGATTMCVVYSSMALVNLLVDSENGTPNKDNGFDKSAVYAVRADKSAPGMTFKEALGYYKRTGVGGFRINGYAKVTSSAVARAAIVSMGPVLVGLPVYSDGPAFWRRGPGRMMGGHAVCLVGYSSDGFVLRNSWGAGWADGGYSMLPYREFDSCVMEAWTVTL